jgi:hypothetical protein
MYWDVVEVRPVAPRTLMVRFADGLNGTIHISRAFCTGVFEALLEDAAVAQAQVEHGVVVWPNGLDLAPDTMYREIRNNPKQHYEVGSRQVETVD